jgi:hypothetical protein
LEKFLPLLKLFSSNKKPIKVIFLSIGKVLCIGYVMLLPVILFIALTKAFKITCLYAIVNKMLHWRKEIVITLMQTV